WKQTIAPRLPFAPARPRGPPRDPPANPRGGALAVAPLGAARAGFEAALAAAPPTERLTAGGVGGVVVPTAVLRRHGVDDATLRTVIAYTLGDRVFVTDEQLAVMRRLQAAGLQPADFLDQVLAHEHAYRVDRPTSADALPAWRTERRANAQRLAGQWVRALAAEAEAALTRHPVLAALGTDALPTTAEPPAGAYGEYFGNPDFRSSAEDQRRYLADPPVDARVSRAAHALIDRMWARGALRDIPRADLHAVIVYLMAFYAGPNAALRSGDPERIRPYEAFIRVATSGFNQLHTVDGPTAYRGIWLSQPDIARLPETHPVGGLVVDPGFGSTELPWVTRPGADPTAGLRTVYFHESPVTIEVRSHTGRDSYQVIDWFDGGRFLEVTFAPGSAFAVRDVRLTRHEDGAYTAHMVWEDVSHLAPRDGRTLRGLHRELVDDLAALRTFLARAEADPISPAEALEVVERAERALAGGLPQDEGAAPHGCAQCGEVVSADHRFCEGCGAPQPSGGALAVAPLGAARAGFEAALAETPPVRVLTNATGAGGLLVPAATLRARGVGGETLRTVIAYTLDGRVHVVDEQLAVMRRLQAKGLLPADFLERVLAHEHTYRVNRPSSARELPAWREARRRNARSLAGRWLAALEAERAGLRAPVADDLAELARLVDAALAAAVHHHPGPAGAAHVAVAEAASVAE